MITKTTIVDFFSKGKIIFATVAAIITFSITMYNQFKTTKSTEISGRVSANKDFDVPVDAIVRISSPVQAQTETDSRGRFKFKLQNLQSDTFLLIVQNKKNNTVTKQNEYVNASSGRTDIEVFFDPDMRPGHIYTSYDKDDTLHQNKKQPNIKKILHGLFR
jgi:hypothetical protein